MLVLERFRQALDSFPEPDFGKGCNLRIMGAANHGIRAGLEPQEIFRRIRVTISLGRCWVSDGEIARAVNMAMADYNRETWMPTPWPVLVVKDGKEEPFIVINSPNVKSPRTKSRGKGGYVHVS